MQVARDKLISLGSSIGKLTHTGKFRLTIGALDILSQHAKYKVSSMTTYTSSLNTQGTRQAKYSGILSQSAKHKR